MSLAGIKAAGKSPRVLRPLGAAPDECSKYTLSVPGGMVAQSRVHTRRARILAARNRGLAGLARTRLLPWTVRLRFGRIQTAARLSRTHDIRRPVCSDVHAKAYRSKTRSPRVSGKHGSRRRALGLAETLSVHRPETPPTPSRRLRH